MTLEVLSTDLLSCSQVRPLLVSKIHVLLFLPIGVAYWILPCCHLLLGYLFTCCCFVAVVDLFFGPVLQYDHFDWEREKWSILVYLFVYLACATFCHFSLPLGVRGWLWLVIVALPGLFISLFNVYYGSMSFSVIQCNHFYFPINATTI